jgi:hypothetical protein
MTMGLENVSENSKPAATKENSQPRSDNSPEPIAVGTGDSAGAVHAVILKGVRRKTPLHK